MKKRSIFLSLLLCAILLPLFSTPALADLDEILRYEVAVSVNDDATLSMVYHIDWMVLDSTSDGPLSWVQIGVPNRHYSDLRPISPAVRSVSDDGSYVRVDLDREYYAGEVAEIEFSLTQDYMYQVDEFTEGETVYHFTPGWFDDIRVDELTIRWDADKAISQTPASLMENGAYVWTSSLGKGEHFTVSVTYPDDAFAFDLTKTAEFEEEDDTAWMVLGVIIFLALFLSPFLIVGAVISRAFNKTARFSSGTEKKITRTKVVYYPTCPGCGAPRPEGKNNCDYCGRSFIKSEEVIKEEDIPTEEKALRGKTTDGLYRYASQPDTYVRVHVTHVPIPVSHSGGSSTRSHSSHSSCAHSSCACACACACAGGGRAGCTVKDFYNTGLKLRQLSAHCGRKDK